MSFIKIEHDYMRTPEYLDFMSNKKCAVYYFLLSAVIRESKEVKNPIHKAFYIYKEHFLKGRLVARYSQKKMAEYFKTSQSQISIRLNKLEKDGLIKKIVVPTKVGNLLYYQFGVWEGTFGEDSYREILWSDVIFSGYYKARKDKEAEQRRQEGYDGLLTDFDGDKDALDRHLSSLGFGQKN